MDENHSQSTRTVPARPSAIRPMTTIASRIASRLIAMAHLPSGGADLKPQPIYDSAELFHLLFALSAKRGIDLEQRWRSGRSQRVLAEDRPLDLGREHDVSIAG